MRRSEHQSNAGILPKGDRYRPANKIKKQSGPSGIRIGWRWWHPLFKHSNYSGQEEVKEGNCPGKAEELKKSSRRYQDNHSCSWWIQRSGEMKKCYPKAKVYEGPEYKILLLSQTQYPHSRHDLLKLELGKSSNEVRSCLSFTLKLNKFLLMFVFPQTWTWKTPQSASSFWVSRLHIVSA